MGNRIAVPEHAFAGAICEPHLWQHEPHWVYEFYNADDVCLYIGRTIQLGSRIAAHRAKPWWLDVARIESHVRDDYWSAAALERQRVEDLDPMHNTRLVPS